MSTTEKRLLERNLKLFGYFKIFGKQVYVPLIAIYLVDVGGITLAEVGLLTVIAATAWLAADIPTGYFADRAKRRTSMIIGAIILICSALSFVLFPSFTGGAVAMVAMSFGFSFIGGAAEALIHDSLETLGRIKDYVKEVGRAQSKGLLGNVVLVGLVPLTYALDKKMPFILGVVAFLILLGIAWFMTEPPRIKEKVNGHILRHLVTSLRFFINRRSILLFFSIGLLTAVYVTATNFNNLIFVDLGLDPSLIGIAFAGSSMVGAAAGYLVHHTLKISFRSYILFDIAICSLFYISVGLTQNLPLMMVAFMFNLGFWRVRNIVYQHNLLSLYKTKNKATLISTIGFFEKIHAIWLPLIFVFIIQLQGYYNGYVLIGLATAVTLTTLFITALKILPKPEETKLEQPV